MNRAFTFIISLGSLSVCAQQIDIKDKVVQVNHALKINIHYETQTQASWNTISYEIPQPHELINYLTLLEKEYCKYPLGYLGKASIKTIVLVKNLKLGTQPRAAIPDPYKKQLILCINGAFGIASERYLAHVMHHELHHCTEYAIWNSMTYDWKDWITLNVDGFCYGEGGSTAYPEYISKGTDFYNATNPQKGFINLYSITGDEEDRAELMAFLMTDAERPLAMGLFKKDEILRKKTKLLLQLLQEFSENTLNLPLILLSEN